MKKNNLYTQPEIQAFVLSGDICAASDPGASATVDNYQEQTFNWV